MKNIDEKMEVECDDFYAPEVGDWSEDKYRLLAYYITLFSTSMKSKWVNRIYIDLFSGAGKAKIRGSKRLVRSSSLIALGVDCPFDRYIFCDQDPECIRALTQRVYSYHPQADVRCLCGDANMLASRILGEMPSYGPGNRSLGFCFADPFRLRDLQFSTVQQLSKRFMDFLILLPTGMDGARNQNKYLEKSNEVVARFLGAEDWRDHWRRSRDRFDIFLSNMYSNQMKTLGYIYGGMEDAVLVRSTNKKLPLYRLGFFSRNQLGQKFWRDARKYTDSQLNLFD